MTTDAAGPREQAIRELQAEYYAKLDAAHADYLRRLDALRPEEPPPQQCPLCKKLPTAKAGTAMAICSDDDHRILICRDCARDVGEFFGLRREHEAEVASLRAQLTEAQQELAELKDSIKADRYDAKDRSDRA
jgi:hypothetical protein